MIAASSILSDLQGKLDQYPDEEAAQEDDGKDHDKWREVEPHPTEGKHPPHRPQDRFLGALEEPNDGIVGIGAHPRDQGADDDDPHIDEKANVDHIGQEDDEIAQDRHKASLAQHDEA